LINENDTVSENPKVTKEDTDDIEDDDSNIITFEH
jgi:hypothetical protein